jgi:hypothetical protein
VASPDRNSTDERSGLEQLARVPAAKATTPAYLTFADYPWLAALLEGRRRFVGQRRREWRTRISEPFSFATPVGKLRIALGVLDRVVKYREPREPALDQERYCAEGARPRVGKVVHYKKSVDPRDIIAIVDPVLFVSFRQACVKTLE